MMIDFLIDAFVRFFAFGFSGGYVVSSVYCFLVTSQEFGLKMLGFVLSGFVSSFVAVIATAFMSRGVGMLIEKKFTVDKKITLYLNVQYRNFIAILLLTGMQDKTFFCLLVCFMSLLGFKIKYLTVPVICTILLNDYKLISFFDNV